MFTYRKNIMKYSDGFNRDFNWYLKMRCQYDFDGHLDRDILYDKNGIDGKMAFYIYDSTGKIQTTRHPNLLKSLIKTKGGVNLHIKMYAEDRARGNFPLIEFRALCIKNKSPYWFRQAVEKQKYKYYNIENIF